MMHRVMFRDRNGNESLLSGEYTQSQANARINRIAQAQRDLGAYWVTPEHESFGCSRALWRDDSYIEAWRIPA